MPDCQCDLLLEALADLRDYWVFDAPAITADMTCRCVAALALLNLGCVGAAQLVLSGSAGWPSVAEARLLGVSSLPFRLSVRPRTREAA
jgi:hypothetical protein